MKKTIVVVAVLALVAVSMPVFAHQWGCWRQPNTSVPIRSNGALSSLANQAINEWNNETCLSLPIVGTHTEISAYDGFYGATGWAGLASIQSYSGCNILHCHAQVNRSYSYSNNGYRGIYCQEIGHCFGLDHSNDGGCMGGGYFYSISSGTGYTVVSHNSNDISNMYGCGFAATTEETPDFHVTEGEDHGEDGEELDRPLVHALWHHNPRTLAETIDLSTAIVVAEVTGVWDADDIVIPVEGLNEANEARIPNQRIGFAVDRVLRGKIDDSFQLFHTGNADFVLDGDPPYEVGQRYVLFLTTRPEDDAYLVVSPEGRYQVTETGVLKPSSARDFAVLFGNKPEKLLRDSVLENAALRTLR